MVKDSPQFVETGLNFLSNDIWSIWSHIKIHSAVGKNWRQVRVEGKQRREPPTGLKFQPEGQLWMSWSRPTRTYSSISGETWRPTALQLREVWLFWAIECWLLGCFFLLLKVQGGNTWKRGRVWKLPDYPVNMSAQQCCVCRYPAVIFRF